MAVAAEKLSFKASKKQKLSHVNKKNKIEQERVYSKYEPINSLLKQFVEKSDPDFAWISIDGEGFVANCQQPELLEMLKTVLDEAYDQCIKSAPARKRYFKMRTMHTHKQMFLKVVFSCEGSETYPFTKNILKVRETVEKENGYFDVKCADDETSIMIALHE